MGLDVVARYYYEANDVDELKEAIAWQREKACKFLVLGGGSNIVFTQDFDGLIIHNQILGVSTIQESPELVHLFVGAGEQWHDLVQFAVQRDWYGIENLALIPGSVGAAPIQNIGAYGVEIKDVLLSVHALNTETLEEESFTNEECEFSYRMSVFKGAQKGKYIIFGIEILLSKQAQVNIEYGDIRKVLEDNEVMTVDAKAVFDAVCAIRQSKLPDPTELGNTGSFFKNPIVDSKVLDSIQVNFPEVPHYLVQDNKVKIPAGWLIEKAGWKGKRVGETGNHEKQALVIVNYGEAKGSEIVAHAKNVMASVKDQFGIELEAEVNII